VKLKAISAATTPYLVAMVLAPVLADTQEEGLAKAVAYPFADARSVDIKEARR